MLTEPLVRIAAILAFLAGTFIAGCTTGREQVQDKWDADKAIRLQAAFAAESAARIKEQSLMTKLTEAQNAATEREKKIRTDYDAARRSALGLRDTVAAHRSELSGNTGQASSATADAALQLLGECAGEYGAVAAAADGHASDVQTLSEAWPK